MAQRRNSRGGTVQRRKWVWARAQGDALVAAGTGAGAGFKTDLLTQFEGAYGADLLGATVMRVRGQYFADMASFLAGPGAVGHLTAGIRTYAEPLDPDEETPADTPHADWMSYEPFICAITGDPFYASDRRTVDVQSSRKMEELGTGLLLAVSHNVSGVAIPFSYDLSIGLKLP